MYSLSNDAIKKKQKIPNIFGSAHIMLLCYAMLTISAPTETLIHLNKRMKKGKKWKLTKLNRKTKTKNQMKKKQKI